MDDRRPSPSLPAMHDEGGEQGSEAAATHYEIIDLTIKWESSSHRPGQRRIRKFSLGISRWGAYDRGWGRPESRWR